MSKALIDEIIIYKPNELIEIVNRPISEVGLKVYNFIIKKLQDLETDRIVIPLSELLIENNTNYEYIYNYLDELQKIQVKSIDKRGKLWGSFVLLAEYKKVDEGIFVQVPATIHKALCMKGKKQEELYYTTIKLLEEKSFKCSYSLIFYEIIKKYDGENIEMPIYTLEEIRQMTGTVNKYKLYYDFKKRVLNPAMEEINKFSQKYSYDFKEIKVGKTINKIQFIKEKKSAENIIDITPIKEVKEYSDKFLAAIEKVKKNQYVAKKYSQRAVRKAVQQFGEERVIKAFKEMYKYNRTITSFSKFLNASISEIKENEKLKKEIKEKNITTAEIKQEINKPIDISTFEGMRNFISSELMNSNNIETSKKIIILGELSNLKEVEELKEIVAKYNLEINLKLF
ncbi:MAG: RepB family plasmid replication initiator protein [Fusobacterium sp.]|uniref:RepB family plasmid replication initiator protein n=1 Tax=uncultured Fusobacterium sp. TaxID=159267 RepID=UPI0015A5DD18|nr:RepB family plasmid replication initiator protein [uncultured Fusobacterium sp.]